MMAGNSMSEKDMLADCLNSQKLTTGNYNTFAGECANKNLRDTFLSVLKEEHEIQSDLFCEMHSRGWYPTKPASKQDVDELKSMFPKS